MKAALNGVPSLSVLDGWWIEGHIEGATGWSIGELGGDGGTNTEVDSLYYKLGEVILPLYYNAPEKFAHVMRSAVAFNGSFFNTQRMMFQYLRNAYLPGWTKAQASLL
jgi:starch phosphorylase